MTADRTKEFADFSLELRNSAEGVSNPENIFRGKHSLHRSPQPPPSSPCTPEHETVDRRNQDISEIGTASIAFLGDGEGTPLPDKKTVWDRPEKRGREEEQYEFNTSYDAMDKGKSLNTWS